ncbi:MAG TPA: hypothetical protein VGL53_17505 [Bryobacteraceae bacterium]
MHDTSGFSHDIGPEHPEYQSLIAQCLPQAKPDYTKARLFSLLLIAAGVWALWYNWHTVATEGHYSIRLTLLGPAGLFGGLLILLRPAWGGRFHKGTSSAQKVATAVVFALIVIGSGIEFYVLDHYPSGQSAQSPLAKVPAMSPDPASTDSATLLFMGKQYTLKSFHEKPAATWEYGTAAEPIENWTTLLTFIDRPDVHIASELDGLAQGVESNYRSHKGQILMAKTMRDSSGLPYNYLVAAFEEPTLHRYELNFVKMSIGPKNGIVSIYGVRITDPKDYQAKTKQFLSANSGPIGVALSNGATTPDLAKLPRREF